MKRSTFRTLFNCIIICAVLMLEVISFLPNWHWYWWIFSSDQPKTVSYLGTDTTLFGTDPTLFWVFPIRTVRTFCQWFLWIVIVCGLVRLIYDYLKDGKQKATGPEQPFISVHIMRFLKNSETDISAIFLFFYFSVNLSLMTYFLQPRELNEFIDNKSQISYYGSSPVQFFTFLFSTVAILGLLWKKKAVQPDKRIIFSAVSFSGNISAADWKKQYNDAKDYPAGYIGQLRTILTSTEKNGMFDFFRDTNLDSNHSNSLSDKDKDADRTHLFFLNNKMVLCPGAGKLKEDALVPFIETGTNLFKSEVIHNTSLLNSYLGDGAPFISWGKWGTIRKGIDHILVKHQKVDKVVLLYSEELDGFLKFIALGEDLSNNNTLLKINSEPTYKLARLLDPLVFIESYKKAKNLEFEIEIIKSDMEGKLFEGNGLNFNSFKSIDHSLELYIDALRKEDQLKEYELIFNVTGGTSTVSAAMAIRSLPRNRSALCIDQADPGKIVDMPADKYTASELWEELIEANLK